MFRFLRPIYNNNNLSTEDVPIGAVDLESAVRQYNQYWWRQNNVGVVAVFHNHALVGRIIPRYNESTEEVEPEFQPWKS